MDKVTLDVKPDKGFAVSKVEYTYKSGGSEVTKEAELTDDVYSFTMPAADVTVSADFTHKHTLTHYEAVPATCTEDGNIAYAICNVGEDACGKYYKEAEDSTDLIEITKEDTVIKALGHKYGAWEKLDEQQHQRVCANDKTHTVKADHVWDKGKITKPATVKQNGIKTYTCNDCGATKTEPVPRTADISEKDSPITTPKYGVIAIKGIARGKTAIKFSWNKIKGADRYVIYMCRCNSDEEVRVPKKVKTVKAGTLSWTARSLRKNTKYKYYVVARKKVKGKEKTILRSVSGHTITGNQTKLHTNPKSLKVNKSKVTLTKGKTFRIKSKIEKIYKSKKLLNHVERLRYLSSDKKVAKVSKSGKIKAIANGSCKIYVQAINGMWKTITVTVK